MNITVVQTADATFYGDMLTATSPAVRAYCLNNGLRYESFVGLKRGTMPWHASYNRIYMLKEMVDRKVQGWVLYLDADCVIMDHRFDLRAFLADHNHLAGIFAGYCEADLPYAINTGGFAINLGHPTGVGLALEYWRAAEAIPDPLFDGSLRWGRQIQDDQGMLKNILREFVEERGLGDHLLFERTNESHVNNGPFVRQFLRSGHHAFPARVADIARISEETLAGQRRWAPIDPGMFIEAAHPRLGTSAGRKELGIIRASGTAGWLLTGPYVDLDPGQWTIRIFGRATLPESQDIEENWADVVADEARVTLQRIPLKPQTGEGILADFDIDIAEPLRNVEARIHVGAGCEVEIRAVHFADRAHWIDRDA